MKLCYYFEEMLYETLKKNNMGALSIFNLADLYSYVHKIKYLTVNYLLLLKCKHKLLEWRILCT